MNAFNRLFVSLISIGWIALMAGAIVVIWNNAMEINETNFFLRFAVPTASTSEQTLATIVAAALIIPAAFMLLAEMTLRDRRADTAAVADDSRRRNRDLEERADSLQKQLEVERGRNAEAVRRAADRVEVPAGQPNHRWHMFGR